MGYETRVYIAKKGAIDDVYIARSAHNLFSVREIANIFSNHGQKIMGIVGIDDYDSIIDQDMYGESLKAMTMQDFLFHLRKLCDGGFLTNSDDLTLYYAILQVMEAELHLWVMFKHKPEDLIIVHYGE